jgi:hypothetical protein
MIALQVFELGSAYPIPRDVGQVPCLFSVAPLQLDLAHSICYPEPATLNRFRELSVRSPNLQLNRVPRRGVYAVRDCRDARDKLKPSDHSAKRAITIARGNQDRLSVFRARYGASVLTRYARRRKESTRVRSKPILERAARSERFGSVRNKSSALQDLPGKLPAQVLVRLLRFSPSETWSNDENETTHAKTTAKTATS